MKDTDKEIKKLQEVEESQQVQVAGGVSTTQFKYTAEQYASAGITQQRNSDYTGTYSLMYNGKSIHELDANSIYEKYLEKCLYEQRVNGFINGYLDEMESMFG